MEALGVDRDTTCPLAVRGLGALPLRWSLRRDCNPRLGTLALGVTLWAPEGDPRTDDTVAIRTGVVVLLDASEGFRANVTYVSPWVNM